ncbi:MAG: glycerophosphodiester phosphodiesterase [Acutalibacteraceae bacterium]
MDTVKIDVSDLETKIIAHRGLSGIETENSIAAFIAAANRSYFGIETDVHVTKDNKFIIIHDDNTGRVSNSNYNVEQTDFKTLRSVNLYNFNGNSPRIDLSMPTPEEYFEICKKYDKVSVFELKNEMKKQDIAKLIKLVENINMLENTIFISFSLENLINLKSLNSNLSAQYLVSEINNIDDLITTLKEYSLDLDAYHGTLSKDIIEKMHSAGIKVNAWTVDDVNRANELIDMKIDFITTNILE